MQAGTAIEERVEHTAREEMEEETEEIEDRPEESLHTGYGTGDTGVRGDRGEGRAATE